MKFMVHYNGAAWFVKEKSFFDSQDKPDAKWKQGWNGPIEAEDVEHARRLAPMIYGTPGRTAP